MKKDAKIGWIINKHKETNHMYDKYLPYEFHLRMVVQVFNDFKHLLPKKLFTRSEEVYRGSWEEYDITHDVIEIACYGHDLIEDTRVSYNDVRSNLDEYYNTKSPIADIIYALTNEKGKNRQERANDKYYEGIQNTPGAVFVKLCDRIANVQYSKMTKSKMFEMYKKENDNFMGKLGYNGNPSQPNFELFYYLNKLFKD
jgi:(p)ppGpp synthase/HD superfamily hydrolase